MAKDLRNGSLDIAVLLTEGIVADIAKGNPSKIISIFVESPLIWGIHVPAASPYQQMQDLQGKRYAISRKGSGSHLMAFVDAKNRGWQLADEQLVPVGDLHGAREAFKNNRAEIFMWERFMTQPLVDTGEFRRVDECPTPWPCFVIAARQEVINLYKPQLQKLLQVIYRSNQQLMNNPEVASIVAAKFGLTSKDASAWFSLTKWVLNHTIPPHTLQHVVSTLQDLHLIETQVDYSALYEDIFEE
jgi:ABC-type nitrate/sulfonate/bicarbonate transport system substrate-binding protein